MPPLPAAIRRALPAGYQVLAAERGDLNRDALPDWAVVLNRPDEQKTSDVVAHPTKRPLLLFVGGASGTFTLAARADNAVYCVDCGGMMGDPFQGLAIKNGYFTVEHYGGSAQRWTPVEELAQIVSRLNHNAYRDEYLAWLRSWEA